MSHSTTSGTGPADQRQPVATVGGLADQLEAVLGCRSAWPGPSGPAAGRRPAPPDRPGHRSSGVTGTLARTRNPARRPGRPRACRRRLDPVRMPAIPMPLILAPRRSRRAAPVVVDGHRAAPVAASARRRRPPPRVAAACRSTLVSDSWTTAYATSPTRLVDLAAASPASGRRPARRRAPGRAARRGPPSPGGTRVAAPSPDIRPSSARSASSDSRLVVADRLQALARALSGSRSSTCSATPACIAITASPWPTPSCRSCAIRSRSSLAARGGPVRPEASQPARPASQPTAAGRGDTAQQSDGLPRPPTATRPSVHEHAARTSGPPRRRAAPAATRARTGATAAPQRGHERHQRERPGRSARSRVPAREVDRRARHRWRRRPPRAATASTAGRTASTATISRAQHRPVAGVDVAVGRRRSRASTTATSAHQTMGVRQDACAGRSRAEARPRRGPRRTTDARLARTRICVRRSRAAADAVQGRRAATVDP